MLYVSGILFFLTSIEKPLSMKMYYKLEFDSDSGLISDSRSHYHLHMWFSGSDDVNKSTHVEEHDMLVRVSIWSNTEIQRSEQKSLVLKHVMLMLRQLFLNECVTILRVQRRRKPTDSE